MDKFEKFAKYIGEEMSEESERGAYWDLVYELEDIATTTLLSQEEVFAKIDWDKGREIHQLQSRGQEEILDELCNDVWVKRWGKVRPKRRMSDGRLLRRWI